MDEFRFSWFKLTKKDGKADKDRGEIEVSLQFYSKNAATGSVLDLATKKKHTSLSDIKQSLRKKTTENILSLNQQGNLSIIQVINYHSEEKHAKLINMKLRIK